MTAILQTAFSNAFFLNENVQIAIQFSLKFVPKGPIDNKSVLVQVMACRRSDDKPLSKQMMVRLLMHMYTSFCLSELKYWEPHWVKILRVIWQVCCMNIFEKIVYFIMDHTEPAYIGEVY